LINKFIYLILTFRS